jgi:transcription elongation GreA/GreB family factor
MNKAQLLENIITALDADLELLTTAAKTAHQAATHAECQPDNKYDTTALEASYVAQGQANRAQEIRTALEGYRNLKLQDFTEESPLRLTALVTVEDDEGNKRRFFLGPHAGGLKSADAEGEVMVITPASPFGRALLGHCCGDDIDIRTDGRTATFTITSVC